MEILLMDLYSRRLRTTFLPVQITDVAVPSGALSFVDYLLQTRTPGTVQAYLTGVRALLKAGDSPGWGPR